MPSAGITGLGDERKLRVEGQRDVTDEAVKELVSDGTCRSLRNRAEQIPAARSRLGPMSVDVRRQKPLPGIDVTAANLRALSRNLAA